MPVCVKDKKQCNGCAACKNICPKKCIDMVEDKTGFSYPQVNQDLCINCELCTKICPEINEVNCENWSNPKVYAAWSNDKDIRYSSTSGGIFSEIAKVVLNNSGVVAGAKYNKNNLVEHVLIENISQLESIRQSKYIQSNTKNIYNEIKQKLIEGKFVAFCGAPCQVAALNNFLMKKYDNLLTIDFICRGMNSPKAYKYWLDELEKKEMSKVTRVWFKYKENGWKASPTCTRVDFEKGSYQVLNGEENTFMCGYLGPNLYIRPSCGDCLFKGVPRQADITLADFWGVSSELDDDKGTSLVLVNNYNGEKAFSKMKDNINYFERDFKEILNGNVCFTESVKINEKSTEFLSSLGTVPFSKMVRKYSKLPLHKRVIRKFKRIIK